MVEVGKNSYFPDRDAYFRMYFHEGQD